MITIKKGDILRADMFRSGTGKNGKPYTVGKAKAEKGYDEITVWVDNTDFSPLGNMVSVREILEISLSHHKYIKNGEVVKDENGKEIWFDDFTCRVLLDNYSGTMPEEKKYDGYTQITDESVPF